MARRVAAALVFTAAAAGIATPSLAAMCYDPKPGVHVGFDFEFSSDGKFTESDRAEHDLMRLRRAGIDAVRAERWNGCIRAFVPVGENGHEEMQFFHPDSLERVY